MNHVCNHNATDFDLQYNLIESSNDHIEDYESIYTFSNHFPFDSWILKVKH